MSGSRVLLLGGSGLLGAPVAQALARAGHEVTVVSRGRRPPPEGVRRIAAERRDAASLARSLAGGRYDLAVDFLAYDADDVAAVLGLAGLRIERYVLVSSGQVYLVAAERRPPSREEDGELPLVPEPPAGTRDRREWAYGVGKRRAEAMVSELAKGRGGLDLVLRLPVVQGAGDTTRRLWAYLQRLLDGGPLLLPDGGLAPVRFVWAEDVARVVASLAQGVAPAGRTYNLAQPDEPSLRELLESAAKCLGREAHFMTCSWETAAAHGLDAGLSPYSGPWCSRPDPSRAERELGFRGTPSGTWLPEVVRAHLDEPMPADHPGYARRPTEIELADILSNS